MVKKKTVPKKPKKGKAASKRKSIGRKAAENLPNIRHVGRPTALTLEKIAAISKHIKLGNFAVTACLLEDVPERTFYYWIELGNQDQANGKASIYTEFLQSIKKAGAQAESDNVKIALQGGFGWQANMTWLERRFPDRWGHQTKLSLEEARHFIQRLMAAMALHIPDRELIKKIVAEVKQIEVGKRERAGNA